MGGDSMIVYNRFWTILKTSEHSTYMPIKDHHISSSTIDKPRSNKPLNTTTLNNLFRILNRRIEVITEYVASD